jgi:hypothetical protein
MSAEIATCIYNATPEMFTMLKVFVYSGLKHTGSDIHIYWSDLDAWQLGDLVGMSDRVRLHKVDFSCDSEEHAASQKVRIWRQIAKEHSGKNLMLSDFDMLFVGDPTQVFDRMIECGTEVCFTVKDDPKAKYPVNTGVVFVSRYCSSLKFFAQWGKGISDILEDPIRAWIAVQQFGAVDQSWVAELLLPSGKALSHGCILQSVKASIYNLHKDWDDIPDDCRMIHFKSTWPSVLLHGNDWDAALHSAGWGHREEVKSWEPSFRLWRNTYNEMIQKETEDA